MPDLYSMPIGAPAAYCGGNSDDDGTEESCVTIAPISGEVGAVALGDTKRPDLPALRFTAAEMNAFVRSYAREHGIVL